MRIRGGSAPDQTREKGRRYRVPIAELMIALTTVHRPKATPIMTIMDAAFAADDIDHRAIFRFTNIAPPPMAPPRGRRVQ